jgi:predicted cupin superfamily sugar epimerase
MRSIGRPARETFLKMQAKAIIEKLDLAPHPEGGWYRETWRADAAPNERAAGTAIYFLLEKGQRSHWHRVDSAEIWHYYAGASLRLDYSEDGKTVRSITLGSDLLKGETPQAIMPPNGWQSAESLGDWTLVGCTVSPGFEFKNFELAPLKWTPRES